MTTIILTIIGILLAAAAALMVIFYGGDAFNAGSIGAQANTLQNAGTNVISAVQLQKAETGVGHSATVAALAPLYLKEVPALTGIGTPVEKTAADGGDLSTESYRVTLGTDDNGKAVCKRVNKNLKKAEDSVGFAGKMGCDTATGVFFANL